MKEHPIKKFFKGELLILLAVGVLWAPASYSNAKKSQFAENIKISEEIVKVKNELGSVREADVADLDRVRFLEKYLEVLNHADKNGDGAAGCDGGRFSAHVKNGWTTAIQELDELQNIQVPAKTIFDLINYIETNEESWRSGSVLKPFTLLGGDGKAIRDSNGNEVQVQFEIDNHHNIYIDFKNKRLGEGMSKLVERVLQYKDWSRLKRSTFKNEGKKSESEFQREMAFLLEISKLSAKNRTGLVNVIGYNKNKVFQDMYDEELFDLILENQGNSRRLDKDAKLDILRQLSQGLMQLHKLGICHSDLKPENSLVNKPKRDGDPYVAVISDYGLSYFPRKLIVEGKPRPARGSPHYVAPEIFTIDQKTNGGWIGDNPQEQERNALRADVFSFGVVAYNLIHSEDHPPLYVPWVSCDEKALGFHKCWKKAYNAFLKKLKKEKDPIDQLILSALDPELSTRIGATEFYQGVQRIIADRNQSKPPKVKSVPKVTQDSKVDPLLQVYKGTQKQQPRAPVHEPLQQAY